jgi:hypothetical protein
VSSTTTYRKKRARAYMQKFDISYTHALRLVNQEMEQPEFYPQQPLPETLPSSSKDENK